MAAVILARVRVVPSWCCCAGRDDSCPNGAIEGLLLRRAGDLFVGPKTRGRLRIRRRSKAPNLGRRHPHRVAPPCSASAQGGAIPLLLGHCDVALEGCAHAALRSRRSESAGLRAADGRARRNQSDPLRRLLILLHHDQTTARTSSTPTMIQNPDIPLTSDRDYAHQGAAGGRSVVVHPPSVCRHAQANGGTRGLVREPVRRTVTGVHRWSPSGYRSGRSERGGLEQSPLATTRDYKKQKKAAAKAKAV